MNTIDYDKLYNTNSYGQVKILEHIGKRSGKDYVLIKFINTGNVKEVKLDSVLNGAVRDVSCWIDYNKIYYSNINGPFNIIKYLGIINNHARVLIRFIRTGTVKDVQLRNAFDGKVSDPNLKLKMPINSSLPIDNYPNRVEMQIKAMWVGMMNRCYDTQNKMYKFYGGIGITVSNEWHNFNTFANDILSIPGYDKFYNSPFTHNLDKDYLQLNIPKNLRIYSKNTCCFLSAADNKNLSIIEYRRDNIDRLSSKYFGVVKTQAGNFQSNMYINGNYFYIGTFTNEIAAANAYNYWNIYFHNYDTISLLNEDIPYMPPEEFIKYNINIKEICSIVKNEN